MCSLDGIETVQSGLKRFSHHIENKVFVRLRLSGVRARKPRKIRPSSVLQRGVVVFDCMALRACAMRHNMVILNQTQLDVASI